MCELSKPYGHRLNREVGTRENAVKGLFKGLCSIYGNFLQQVGFSCGRCIDFILQIGVNYTRLVIVSESRIKAGGSCEHTDFWKEEVF